MVSRQFRVLETVGSSPAASTKKTVFDGLFSFCRSRCGGEPTRFDNQAKRVCKLACKRMSADCSSVCSSLTSTVRSTKRNACTEWSIPPLRPKRPFFNGLFIILCINFRPSQLYFRDGLFYGAGDKVFITKATVN